MHFTTVSRQYHKEAMKQGVNIIYGESGGEPSDNFLWSFSCSFSTLATVSSHVLFQLYSVPNCVYGSSTHLSDSTEFRSTGCGRALNLSSRRRTMFSRNTSRSCIVVF